MLLTALQIKRKLKELSKEEMIEWVYDAVKTNKELQLFFAVKLQGEAALSELAEAGKEQIRKEFYPSRGLPRLRTAKVEQALADIKKVGAGTEWPFDMLVYFCEMAVRHIQDSGDIFEEMGDLLTEAYEEVIQTLNEETTPDLYEKYKDRVKAVADAPDCECYGIHDSLAGSYFALKWADHDEEEQEGGGGDSSVISYAAMSKWLKLPQEVRQQLTGNVWCGKCSDVTAIKEFSVQTDKHGIVLQGVCSKCGHPVARFIEE